MKEVEEKDIPITIPFELLRSSSTSKNEMINANDRQHYHIKGVLTKHLRQLGEIEAYKRLGKLTTPLFTKDNPCFITVHICPPSTRRTDAPNWYPTVKALIDGMTDANVFADDDDTIVTGLIFLPGQKTTTKKYHVVLNIYHGNMRNMFPLQIAHYTEKAHKTEVPYICITDDNVEETSTALLDMRTGELTNVTVPATLTSCVSYIIVNDIKLAVKKNTGQYAYAIDMDEWLDSKCDGVM